MYTLLRRIVLTFQVRRSASGNFRPGITILLAVPICFLLMASLMAIAEGLADSDTRLHFNIEAQELTAALRQYADVTGKSVFFDNSLARGKHSVAIQGDYSVEAALNKLLRDSGLSVKNTSGSAFTLVAQELKTGATGGDATTADAHGDGAAQRETPQDWHRARRIQVALEQALCQGKDTYPGTYRALIRLWLDTDGQVQRGGLLGSTGVTKRDRAIDTAIKTLALGPQQPGAATQPVVILLLPRTAGTIDVCQAPQEN